MEYYAADRDRPLRIDMGFHDAVKYAPISFQQSKQASWVSLGSVSLSAYTEGLMPVVDFSLGVGAVLDVVYGLPLGSG